MGLVEGRSSAPMRLIPQVWARLERFGVELDRAAVLSSDAVADLVALFDQMASQPEDFEAAHAAGWLLWARTLALAPAENQNELPRAFAVLAVVHRTLPELVPGWVRAALEQQPYTPDRPAEWAQRAAALADSSRDTGDGPTLTSAVCLFRQALAATPRDHPDLASHRTNLSAILNTRFERNNDPADLEEALELARKAVTATPAGDPKYALRLANLGAVLQNRFRLTGEQADLDAAIEADLGAAAATPMHHPDRAKMLANACVVLGFRFDRTRQRTDLEMGIEAARAAVDATPVAHPDRAMRVFNLGVSLLTRFGQTKEQEDLDEAIKAIRAAAAATPTDHSHHAKTLVVLYRALRLRFERTGQPADLDAAIEAARAASDDTPAADPEHAERLFDLSATLHIRYDRTGNQGDLDAAIHAGRVAAQATPPEDSKHATYWFFLGLALHLRFQRTAELADLDAAIEAEQVAAKATPAAHPEHAEYLFNLGALRQFRYNRTGNENDLDTAINASQSAAETTPPEDPNYARRHLNFTNALRLRFERTGERADLDLAIETGRTAVATVPLDHPDRAAMLSMVGVALRVRFERTGDLTDLNSAVDAGQCAVQAASADHPARAMYLSNLGLARRMRFERTGNQADLDAAIAAGKAAVDEAPLGNPDRALFESNFGAALLIRFFRRGDRADLDAAIDAGRAAVAATPVDHPNRAMYLSILGTSLYARFELAGDPVDLDAAIEAGQAAVTVTPADRPDRAVFLLNLGGALGARFGHAEQVADLNAAIDAYKAAAAVVGAAPRLRARAAQGWGRTAAGAGRWQEAVAAFAAASELLGQVASRSLNRGDQQYLLAEFGGLGADAAACSVRAGIVGRAVELFEQGRGVLLGQALDTRTDLTALTEQHPELAASFIHLRDVLDRTYNPAEQGQPQFETSAAGANQRAAGVAFGELITSIRELEGFRTFLQPLPVAELLTTATDGPVVVVAVSQFGSYALLLTSSGVEAVALADLTPRALYDQVTAFLSALADTTSPTTQVRIRELLGWLWDVLAGPILDRLGFLGPPADGAAWPRVWWCTSGLLSFLPVHAAGHHHTRFDPTPATVLDRVISSYTPTIRVVDHARRSGPTNAGSRVSLGSEGRLVAVAMPHTPGACDLPGAETEANSLRTRFPGRVDVVTGELVSRQTVLDLLPAARWAHFACHGTTDLADPSLSRLLLADQPLTVLDISGLRLHEAQLAFLSACSTAMPSGQLIDEAIHLASAFQLAGYRHVIATLWPIDDDVAGLLADEIYSDLDGPSPAEPAAALHRVIRWLRGLELDRPSLWASHIHNGV
jgi:hypothetical protein